MLTNPKDQITTPQAAVIVTSVIIGVGILTLPRTATEEMGTPDAWIAVIIGGLMSMAIGMMMVKLSQQFPGKTVYQYSQEVAGKWGGWLLNLFLIVYFAVFAGFEIRAIGEVTRTFLLVKTPLEVKMIAMMCVSVYLIVGGINPIARLFELLLPITVMIFLLLIFMGFTIFELDHLRPVLGLGIMPVLKGIPTTTLSYTGFESMLILTSFMGQPDRAGRAVLAGIGASILFYLFTVVMVVGGLSTDKVVTETWPAVTLVESFELTGIIFERYESFLFAIWILQIFTTFSLFYYCASLGLAQLFRKNTRPFIFGLLPVIYIISMTPKNTNDLFKLGDYLSYAFFIVAGASFILLAVARLRGKMHGTNM